MAERNVGKITQIIGAVLDIKFPEGTLPEINSAIDIQTKDGGRLVVEVAQHLGDDTVRCIAMGPTDGLLLFPYRLVKKLSVECLMFWVNL